LPSEFGVDMFQCPNLDQEHKLRSQGYELVAGIDEAGRGALAGPVVAGAVILPCSDCLPWFERVRDSKKLSPGARESLFALISAEALAVGVGIVPAQVIDTINILRATRLAMMQAVEQLSRQPTFLLIDRVTLPQCGLPQQGITRGDSSCLSIACASIIAKVTRDRIMEEADQAYPGYGFARHKGYGTGSHLSCLQRLGPSAIHRLYFAPVRDIITGRDSGATAVGRSEPFDFCHFEAIPTKSRPPRSLVEGQRREGKDNEPPGSR
jgi:ribonuclease HII